MMTMMTKRKMLGAGHLHLEYSPRLVRHGKESWVQMVDWAVVVVVVVSKDRPIPHQALQEVVRQIECAGHSYLPLQWE